uniref:Myb/SANT-like DNA-binding domain-containing protein n=1 Tax=Lygus hesperus TaxID=30085 RepID=A0A146L7M4_LYGHE
MKRAPVVKRSSKSKNPNKGRTFLNRPSPSSAAQNQSKSKPLMNRPASSSNSARPQKRLLTHCSESRLQNQSKRRLFTTTSPTKMVPNRIKTDLDGYLKFGANLDIKQEHEETPVVSNDDLVAIDFDINGQTIRAKISSEMVPLLNEDEALRQQIIEKLVVENAANPGGDHVIIAEQTSENDLPNLNTIEPNISNNSVKAAQGPAKTKKRVRAPVGNRTIVKKIKDSPDDIYDMWGEETVLTLLEVFEDTKEQLRDKKPSTLYFWKIVCKNMKKRGYIRLTDRECQKKFESMEATYRAQVMEGITSQNATWEYFNTMKFLLDNFETTPIEPVALSSKPIVDVTQSSMYQSDGASSSGEEAFTSDEEIHELESQQPSKKKKVDAPEESSDIELLRRTYLQVETKKLKEMKAMRKLQKQQSRLQAERNILLSSLVDTLRKSVVQVRRR